MTSPHKKALVLQIAGLVAMLLALLDDSYLHMPFPLFVSVITTGIVCLFASYRLRRPTQSRPTSITLRQKHQRFAILVAAAFLVEVSLVEDLTMRCSQPLAGVQLHF